MSSRPEDMGPKLLLKLVELDPNVGFRRSEMCARCAVANAEAWKAECSKYQQVWHTPCSPHELCKQKLFLFVCSPRHCFARAQVEVLKAVGDVATESARGMSALVSSFSRFAEAVLKGRAQIPKVIHQIWIGPKDAEITFLRRDRGV